MKNFSKLNSNLFLILTILFVIIFLIMSFVYIQSANVYKACHNETIKLMIGDNTNEKQIKWAAVHPNYQKLFQGCLHSKGIN